MMEGEVSSSGKRASHVAYLAPALGAVTSTFIYREIEAVRARGVEVATFSTRRPSGEVVSAEAESLLADTTYLYELPRSEIAIGALTMAVRRPLRFLGGLCLALRDACGARVSAAADRLKLLWHFVVGSALARRLADGGHDHIHAHFAHMPTSIAMYAAHVAGVTYSFTAHANDIFERPVALKEKVRRSAFTACISEYNRRHLIEAGCLLPRLSLVRCGLDVEQYAWRRPERRDGAFEIYAVGRLVEKKGIEHLVRALAMLRDQGRSFRCRIVGGGPLLEPLRVQVAQASLEGHVELLGAQPQERVKALFGEADAFVLPCVVAASGDRDGIPVALMEAMALGVPVISTGVSGIPELIQPYRNGLLAAPGDAESLAEQLAALMDDAELAVRLSEAARRTIETEFEVGRNAAILARRFVQAAGTWRPIPRG
ncbi:MAG: glycosyltransferase [Nitrospiraceae bacterium]|nr:glycosyltransferase [Nitrospiraceae bacterium]